MTGSDGGMNKEETGARVADTWSEQCAQDVSFAVWPTAGSEAVAWIYSAVSAQHAAELRANEDWLTEETGWPVTYYARDRGTGVIWEVQVAMEMRPTFVTKVSRKVPLPAATHVLWIARALCEDSRLRGVPDSWPNGQRWIPLSEVEAGARTPDDHCERCWSEAPKLLSRIQRIGDNR